MSAPASASGPATSLGPARNTCLPEVLPETAGLGGGCREEPGEPNNTPGTATLLRRDDAVMERLGGLCDGQEDWLAVALPAGESLEVRLETLRPDVDVMLELYESESALVPLGRSQRTTPEGALVPPVERITLTALATARTPLVRVRWAPGAARHAVNYRLTVTRAAMPACPPDDGEVMPADDTESSARALDHAARQPFSACQGNTDHHLLQVLAAGMARVRVRAAAGSPVGGLTATVLTPNAEPGMPAMVRAGPSQSGADGTVDLSWTADAGPALLRVEVTSGQVSTDYVVELRDGFCVDDAAEAQEGTDGGFMAAPLGVGAAANGVLCGNNADTVRFVAARNGPVVAHVEHVPAAGRVLVTATLDGRVDPLASGTTYSVVDGATTVNFMAVAGGVHAITLQHESGLGSTPWRVVLEGAPTCADPADPGTDGGALPTRVFTGLAANGRLCGEEDLDIMEWVAPPDAGTRRFSVQRPRDADVVLSVVDADGGVVPFQQVDAVPAPGSHATEAVFNAGGGGDRFRLDIRSSTPTVPFDYAVRVLPPAPAHTACSAARVITPGQDILDSTEGATAEVSLRNDRCTGNGTEGPDLFYRLTVPAGRSVLVTLAQVQVGAADMVLYLLDGCDTRCCWAGADDNAGGAGESLAFSNADSFDAELILGVDGVVADGPGSAFVLRADLL